MKEFLQAVAAVIAFFTVVYAWVDHASLKHHLEAHRTAAPKTDTPAGEAISEPTERAAEIVIAAGTALLAVFTLWLFLDAREKGRLELRAYIGVKPKGIRRLPNGQYQAVITIVNSGKTLARDARLTLSLGVGNPATFEFGEASPSAPRPLAPGEEWESRHVLWDLDVEDPRIWTIARMHSGVRAFVWGRVEYQDIYGVAHHTTFRWDTREVAERKVSDAGGTGRIVDGWSLTPTAAGNSAT